MKTDRTAMAKELKALRTKSGLTQEKVRKALKYQTIQFISNWERGVAGIPPKAVGALAKIYKVKPQFLIDLMVDDYRKKIFSEARL